jgi:hypothetical protein
MDNNISESFISYSPEKIRLIGETIIEILDEDILNVLREIKKNNRFIRRRSPVKLKYTLPESVATTWRKEKEEGAKLNDFDLFQEKLNSNLNKISNSNFKIIEETIKEILLQNQEEKYKQKCLEILFQKSINESYFGILYSRLCNSIIKIYGEDFRKNIKNKCDIFYNENIVKIFKRKTNISYDELCKINKEKSKLIGSFIFMSGLYINSIIDYDFIIKYFNILIDAINDDSNSDNYEKYIECLVNFVTNIGKKMEKESGDSFKEIVIEQLLEIKNDRRKFKPRSRFLVMDLLDLHSKNWLKD